MLCFTEIMSYVDFVLIGEIRCPLVDVADYFLCFWVLFPLFSFPFPSTTSFIFVACMFCTETNDTQILLGIYLFDPLGMILTSMDS